MAMKGCRLEECIQQFVTRGGAGYVTFQAVQRKALKVLYGDLCLRRLVVQAQLGGGVQF